MSTITIVKKSGYAAVAADSLTKYGANKESADYIVNHSKIIQIQDCFLAISGPTSSKLVLKHYFTTVQSEASFASVDNIFNTWLALHNTLKEQYFLRPDEDDEDSYESSRMDVLIASPQGIFGVAAHRSVQEFSKFYAYGYGSEYALGAMYAVYDDPSRSAEDVARLGVQAASVFDDTTGLPIISYTVKQNV
jgi:ATP-dependent HslUV protease, peptidase subunit HslV